jgi:uncharacterized repeat protein (TIGR01451 family)
MKKTVYFSILIALLLCAGKSKSQYYITSHTLVNHLDSAICYAPELYVTTNAYSGSLTIKSNDGMSILSTPIVNGGSYGYAYIPLRYNRPGPTTTQLVLTNGTAHVDSVKSRNEYLYCNTFTIKAFNDVAGTGVYDSITDNPFCLVLKVEVSYNGTVKDTITMTSGCYYAVSGYEGDVYSFRIVSFPPGLSLTTPASGIIKDTIMRYINGHPAKYFGFSCSTTTAYDLGVNAVVPVTGIHDQWGNIYVYNNSCSPKNANVTLTFSSKYTYSGDARPTPSAASGNTITWNLTGLSAVSSPVDLYYVVWDNAGTLVAGDTVHEFVRVTPTIADADVSNNTELIIDTVRAGVDPNEMSVSPAGYIPSGTQLKYAINFENTGNDTAYNISVYDTLSDNIEIKSLNLVMASAVMNIAQWKDGPHNIIKFDFPNINLLDSSHHGQCNGSVIFTVNAKAGLPAGTEIYNRAGIYFDYNPVVMTNTVENIIGIPSGVSTVSNQPRVNVHPNPANDILTIETGSGEFNTVTISNIIGIRLFSQPLSGTETKVNVRDLPTGIYFVTLKGEGSTGVVKFEKM